MSLVIKSLGTTAPEVAKKLYRDALVEEGSLFLVDFSNKGTLINFNTSVGSPVFDLSRESSNELGISTQGEITPGVETSLTEGRGVDFNNSESGGDKGIIFSDSLLNYLESNQPHSILIVWLRLNTESDKVGTQVFRTVNGSDASVPNIRLNYQLPSIGPVISFGGASSFNQTLLTEPGDLVQIGIEFKGIGNPVSVYKNGSYLGESSSATGFAPATHWGIGKMEFSAISAAVVYRTLIEDLDVSGRSGLEVMQKDYNYVNAIGEFEGIVKRPFVDNL